MTKRKKVKITVVIVSTIIAFLTLFAVAVIHPGENEQLQKAEIESAQYTKQYIQVNAADYQKEFGALKDVKDINCRRQYNDYKTIGDAWHHTNGTTWSTCHAHVEFENDNATVTFEMNRPADSSADWRIYHKEIGHGFTN